MEDAARESGDPVRRRSVDVLCAAWLLYVVVVKGHEPLPPVGHVVLQVSPVRQRVPVENAVVDA